MSTKKFVIQPNSDEPVNDPPRKAPFLQICKKKKKNTLIKCFPGFKIREELKHIKKKIGSRISSMAARFSGYGTPATVAKVFVWWLGCLCRSGGGLGGSCCRPAVAPKKREAVGFEKRLKK